MHSIAKEQLEWIDKLECVRLSKSEIAQDFLCEFECPFGNKALTQYIWENALDDDTQANTTVYAVLNESMQIVFIFALRCGLLFDGQLNDSMVKWSRAHAGEIDMTEEIKYEILEFQLQESLSDNELYDFLNRQYSRYKELMKFERVDTVLDDSKDVHRVYRTMPAIEISHFCRNGALDSVMPEGMFPSQKLGKIIFWFKLFPLLKKVRETIGFEYVYLFAADNTENRDLVNYYRTYMNFQMDRMIGVNKPAYDSNCIFLCQKYSDMGSVFDKYIEQFNPSNDAI